MSIAHRVRHSNLVERQSAEATFNNPRTTIRKQANTRINHTPSQCGKLLKVEELRLVVLVRLLRQIRELKVIRPSVFRVPPRGCPDQATGTWVYRPARTPTNSTVCINKLDKSQHHSVSTQPNLQRQLHTPRLSNLHSVAKNKNKHKTQETTARSS